LGGGGGGGGGGRGGSGVSYQGFVQKTIGPKLNAKVARENRETTEIDKGALKKKAGYGRGMPNSKGGGGGPQMLDV